MDTSIRQMLGVDPYAPSLSHFTVTKLSINEAFLLDGQLVLIPMVFLLES